MKCRKTAEGKSLNKLNVLGFWTKQLDAPMYVVGVIFINVLTKLNHKGIILL